MFVAAVKTEHKFLHPVLASGVFQDYFHYLFLLNADLRCFEYDLDLNLCDTNCRAE